MVLMALLIPPLAAAEFDPVDYFQALKPSCEVVYDEALASVDLLAVDHLPTYVPGATRVWITASGVRLEGAEVDASAGLKVGLLAALAGKKAEDQAFDDQASAIFGASGAIGGMLGGSADSSPPPSSGGLIGALGGYSGGVDDRAQIIAAPDAPAASVAEALAALHEAAYTEVGFVARSTHADALPPAPSSGRFKAFEAALSSDAMTRQTSFADALSQAAGCQGVRDAMGSVANVALHLRCAALMDAMGPAVAACPAADVEMLVGLTTLMHAPGVWTTHIERKPDPAASPIVAAAGDTWAQLGPRIFAAEADTIWIAAE